MSRTSTEVLGVDDGDIPAALPEVSLAGANDGAPGPGAEAMGELTTSGSLLTRRVVHSTGALLIRSAWERVTALGVVLVVARLILPRQFGEASLALSTVAFATIIVDAGITTALVRRRDNPTPADFAAARRVQFALAVGVLALAAVAFVFNHSFGSLVFIDALQLLTDPFVLEKKVRLERTLEFKGLATADGAGILTRSGVSLLVVLVDRGPLCLVLGDLSAAIVYAGVVVFLLRPAVAEHQDARPRPTAKGLLGEGLPFQLFGLINSLRDASSSALISGLAGLTALGLFQFAYRMVSPMWLILASLNQLSVAVGMHLARGGRGTAERTKDGYLLAGLATAMMMATVAASAHWLVPALFGARWSQSVPLILAMAFGVVINGPAIGFGIGLIFAADRGPRFGTVAALAAAVVFLLGLVGFHALGGQRSLSLAWVSSAVFEAVIILYGCHRCVGLRLLRQTLIPIPVFIVAYLAGYEIPSGVHGRLVPILMSAGVAAAVSIGCTAVFGLPAARRLWRATRVSRATPGGNL